MILKSSLQSDYTVTDSFVNITGLSITIHEDGYYDISGNVTCNAIDSDSTQATAVIKLAINGTYILASGGIIIHQDGANANPLIAVIPINNKLYLKKDDIVTVQAKMATGDNCTVQATNASYATYIEAINLTKLARGGM